MVYQSMGLVHGTVHNMYHGPATMYMASEAQVASKLPSRFFM